MLITQRILLLMLPLLVLASCDLETSGNGKLDGLWHLERVDTLSTGGQADLGARRVFWAVQVRLIHLRDHDRGAGGCFMRFRQTSDSLTLYSPYTSGGHEDQEGGGDHPGVDRERLAAFGVLHEEEHFYKERLTGSDMTLRSGQLRLYFRKF